MTMKQRYLMLIGVLVAGLLVVGCGEARPYVQSPGSSSTPNETASRPTLTAGMRLDQAAIYSAVVRQLYTVDHTFGEPPNFPVVYLVGVTDDGAGSPGGLGQDGQSISFAVRTAITSALADLPARFVWVEDAGQVPRDAYDRVEGQGAIITLGNIHAQPDGTVHVPASIYVGMLIAGGQTYQLGQVDGAWQVIGTVGSRWMS